jgi:hypothetical protein
MAEPASTLARGLQFNEAVPAKEDSTILPAYNRRRLPGQDGPAQVEGCEVEALYARGREWLAGGALRR